MTIAADLTATSAGDEAADRDTSGQVEMDYEPQREPNEAIRAFWRSCIVRVICNTLHARRRKTDDPEIKLFLGWRLAVNYYEAGQYDRAMPQLEASTEGVSEDLHPHYIVHLTAARCAMKLYATYGTQNHLEAAYRHYSHSINKLGLYISIAKLPGILHEFGYMLEHYCSYDAALDLYRRILETFPYYRGFFEVMYRTVIVGKYLTYAMTDVAERENVLNQCSDNLSLLLEAVPVSINEIHVLFLYARSLEGMTGPKHAGRSDEAYQNLFASCIDLELAVDRQDTFDTFENWFYRLETWMRLGEVFTADGEIILAMEAYHVLEARLAEQEDMAEGPSNQLRDTDVTVRAYLKLARIHEEMKAPSMALRYAKMAFQRNHFDAEARAVLSSYSSEHKQLMDKENQTFKGFAAIWRQRFLTGEYLKNIKKQVVADLEEKLARNRLDPKIRKKLAYYDREKYRALFAFENICAKRIQRRYRTRRILRYFFGALTHHYQKLATAVYKRYTQGPYDATVRKDLRRVAASKFCPKRHRIHQTVVLIDHQDRAVMKIRGFVKAYFLRNEICRRIDLRRREARARLYRAATALQCMYRAWKARRVTEKKRDNLGAMTEAAVRVQRFIRQRNTTFKHSVTRMVVLINRDKEWAWNVMRYNLRYWVSRFVCWLRDERRRQWVQLQREEEEASQEEWWEHLNRCASCISRFVRLVVSERRKSLARRVFAARRRAYLSRPCREYASAGMMGMRSGMLALVDDGGDVGTALRPLRPSSASTSASASATSSSAAAPPTATVATTRAQGPLYDISYRPPGIKQNTPQFLRSLEQTTVLCGPTFEAADCMMSSAVLRHYTCKTRSLILRDIQADTNPSFEFDLLPALAKCRSIRQVRVLGGRYTPTFLQEVMSTVQMNNPRINEVYVESLASDCVKRFSSDLALWAGNVVCDYFNYQLPGLRILSLHGCSVRDADLVSIAEGLGVSSSLTELYLSTNLLTDAGLVRLLEAITANKHRALRVLDVSHNFIRCSPPVHPLLDKFETTTPLHVKTHALTSHYCVLEVVALHNPVANPFRPRAIDVLAVHFSAADIKEAARARAVAAGIIAEKGKGTGTPLSPIPSPVRSSMSAGKSPLVKRTGSSAHLTPPPLKTGCPARLLGSTSVPGKRVKPDLSGHQ